jgi:hypothetical protein
VIARLLGALQAAAKMTRGDEETRIGGPRGPKPRKRIGARVVSRRRAAKLKRAAAIAGVVNEGMPKFSGDSVAFLRSVYEDLTVPPELRVVAARCATSFERASYQPKPEEKKPLVNLNALTDAEKPAFHSMFMRVLGQSPPAIEQKLALPRPEAEREQIACLARAA